MNNIISNWKKQAKIKYGSITEGVKRLNMICSMKIRVPDISSMERGERNIPACVHNLMLNDVLITVLEDAGYKNEVGAESMTDFIGLVDSLSPPRRVNK